MLPSLTMPNDLEQTQNNSNKKPPKSYHTLDQTRSPNTRSMPPGVRWQFLYGAQTGMVTLSWNRHPPTHNLCLYRPSFKLFEERLLSDPTTQLKTSHCYPHQLHLPPPPPPPPPIRISTVHPTCPKDDEAPPLRPETIGHNPLTATTLPNHHLFYCLGLDTRKVWKFYTFLISRNEENIYTFLVSYKRKVCHYLKCHEAYQYSKHVQKLYQVH